MYCLRLFVLQELHCLLQRLLKLLWCVPIKRVYTKFHLDWLLCEWNKGHLCPYHNVWPEAVLLLFTRTTLFTKLFVYLSKQS